MALRETENNAYAKFLNDCRVYIYAFKLRIELDYNNRIRHRHSKLLDSRTLLFVDPIIVFTYPGIHYSDQQRVLWYVMVFSVVVNCLEFSFA